MHINKLMAGMVSAALLVSSAEANITAKLKNLTATQKVGAGIVGGAVALTGAYQLWFKDWNCARVRRNSEKARLARVQAADEQRLVLGQNLAQFGLLSDVSQARNGSVNFNPRFATPDQHDALVGRVRALEVGSARADASILALQQAAQDFAARLVPLERTAAVVTGDAQTRGLVSRLATAEDTLASGDTRYVSKQGNKGGNEMADQILQLQKTRPLLKQLAVVQALVAELARLSKAGEQLQADNKQLAALEAQIQEMAAAGAHAPAKVAVPAAAGAAGAVQPGAQQPAA